MTGIRHDETAVEGPAVAYRIDLPGQIRAATLVRRMDKIVAGSSVDAASRRSRTVVSIADCGTTLVCDQRFIAYRGRFRTVSCVVSEYCADQLVRQGDARVMRQWPAGRSADLGRSLLGLVQGFAIADEFVSERPAGIAGPRVDLAQRSPSVVSVRTPTRRFVEGVRRDVVPIEMRASASLGGRRRIRPRRPYAVLYVDPAAEPCRAGSRLVGATFSIRGLGNGENGYLELDN